MAKVKWIVKGAIPSIKNSLRVGKYGNFYHVGGEIASYKRSFALQTPAKFKQGYYRGGVSVKVRLIRNNKRKDVLNMVGTIADSLEFAKVIHNDRQIVRWEIDGSAVDKSNPLVDIEVSYE